MPSPGPDIGVQQFESALGSCVLGRVEWLPGAGGTMGEPELRGQARRIRFRSFGERGSAAATRLKEPDDSCISHGTQPALEQLDVAALRRIPQNDAGADARVE